MSRALVVVSFCLLGCSSDPAVVPATAMADAGADAAPPVPISPADGGSSVPAPDAGPPVVGAEGTKVVSADGRAQVSVPPFALVYTAAITIAPSTRPTDATIVSKAYELSPNKTTFERDVDLCIETSTRVNAQDVCLAYFDETSSKWTCEDTCLKRKADTNMLCGKTDHFTSFAILLRPSGASSEGACQSTLVPPGGGGIAAPDGLAVATFLGGTLPKPSRVTITKLPTTGSELVSGVYDLASRESIFARDVEICIRRDAGKDASRACLGYLDEAIKPPVWKCEDRCLTRKGDDFCGATNHFTSFALLLGGGGGAATASCSDAVVPEAGATVSAPDNASSFIAQQGTFAKPTRVTIARGPSEKGLGSDVVELLPDGVLAKPGKVCITPTPGLDLRTACLGFKDATGGWKCQDTCLKQGTGDLICGETDHFTSFAILLTGGTGLSCVIPQ